MRSLPITKLTKMQILNIAGYKFIELHDIASLRHDLLQLCHDLNLKGTILLSHEGININLAGGIHAIQLFQIHLKDEILFKDIKFHESYSLFTPFKHLKIKLKNEIITLRQAKANPLIKKASYISAPKLKEWLDQQRDITLLDTRNEYEVRFGTFTNSTHLHLRDFSEFPYAKAIENLDKDKPLVTFCTGGIRCEKAAVFLLKQGFSNVYQLHGGILAYFAQVSSHHHHDHHHYQGHCFIFDERIALNTKLQPSGMSQCSTCQGPIPFQSICPACHGKLGI